MTTPRVSVIIPNYNYVRSLPLCLESVAAQSLPPHEIIVVDDGSTDGSVEVARAQPGVKVLQTESNGGCAAARNLGVRRSTGDVLFFLDSDVALEPTAIENAVQELDRDPQLGAVCGVHDPEPLIRDSRFEEYRSLQYHFWSKSSEGDVSFLFPAMCAIPAAIFAQIGPFNTGLKQTEEVDYGDRLNKRYRVLLTSVMRGRHDHDSELVPLLRKLFHRARFRIPLYARRRRFARGFETASRAWGSIAALGAVATIPLVALGPAGLLVPGALLALSLTCDASMYRFVRARRGSGFLAYFMAVHFLVNVTIATGVGAGVLQWLTSPGFRRIYDDVAAPAGPAAVGARGAR